MLEPFGGMNTVKPTYRERVKPFNFMLSARIEDSAIRSR